jgi:hypothetical protein
MGQLVTATPWAFSLMDTAVQEEIQLAWQMEENRRMARDWGF